MPRDRSRLRRVGAQRTSWSMPRFGRCGECERTQPVPVCTILWCRPRRLRTRRRRQSATECADPGLAPGVLHFANSALDLGPDAAKRLRRVDIDERGLAVDRRPRPRPRCSGRSGGARRRRPRSPSDRGRTAATTAPDCRACPRTSAPPPARPGPDRRRRSAGRSGRRRPAACRRGRRSRRRRPPAPPRCRPCSEVPRPSAKSGLCTSCTGRPASACLDLLALVAGHHDHRPGARRQRLLGRDAHQRPCRDLGQELVRSAHAGRAAGGEHDRGDAPRCRPPAPSRGCGRVTISISRPPTPMPVMASRGTSSPASSRISTQSKPFSLGERAQPGAPSTGRPRASADQQQVAGIDRHAEMLDRARRSPRPRPGSRRAGRRWRRRRTR